MKILLILAVGLMVGFGLARVESQESKTNKKMLPGVITGPAFTYLKGPLPEPSTVKAFAPHISELREAGYVVEMFQPASGFVLFYLAGTELEKRPPVGFGWKVQFGATASYLKVGNSWTLGHMSIKAWDKPPVIGGWEMIPVDPEKQAKVMKIFGGLKTVEILEK